jgi:hypothetical protein
MGKIMRLVLLLKGLSKLLGIEVLGLLLCVLLKLVEEDLLDRILSGLSRRSGSLGSSFSKRADCNPRKCGKHPSHEQPEKRGHLKMEARTKNGHGSSPLN